MKRTLTKSFILILIVSALVLNTQNIIADVKAKTDALLKRIETYEFGQSRESLTMFAELVRSSIDSQKNKKLIEKGMLAFLKSDATLAGKQFICKQLSIIGTEDAVPILSPMLINKETSDIARYALERIPGRRVDKALRDALSKTKGEAKVGIINTLGQRKDERSVRTLSKLVYDSNKTIAGAAAAALGKIANPKACEILAEAIDKTKGSVKSIVLDSYLLCADQLCASDNKTEALEIYKKLFASDYSMPIRSAALRGIITASGDKGSDIILKTLKTENEKIKTTAISMIRELPQSQKIDKIVAELPNLSVTNKIQLLAALADRGDASAHGHVVNATKDENVEVRIAAMKALVKLGDETDIDLLIKIAADGDFAEKETARETLGRLNGAKIDETIIANIDNNEPEIQVELIQSVGSRNISNAVDVLLKTATSEHRKVRLESIKSLEMIGSPKDLDSLVDLLLNVQSDVERRRAEKAVVAVAHKIEKQDEQATVVLKKLPSQKDIKDRCSLLRVLGNIGDPNGLPVLQESLKDKNEDIQKAAIQALTDWPTPEPLVDLLAVVKSSKNETHQILALRGHIRLLGLPSDRSKDETIQLYKTAMKLAKNTGEKRLALSGISNIRTVNALNTAASFLTDTELKNEAEVAVIRIADRIRRNFPKETKAVLLKVVDSKNSEVSSRARRYLKEIDK